MCYTRQRMQYLSNECEHGIHSIFFQWRPRYVVFKVTSSGRFQLMIYKEHPPTAANEVKEVPIEEFGGLDINPRIDNERNIFAVITTKSTDCFSAETPEEMVNWTSILQEYLGKGVVNILTHKYVYVYVLM